VNGKSTFKIAIERAHEQHLAEIAALAGVVWRAHYPGIISHEQIDYMLARMYDLDVLRRDLASGICFERALVNDELRGFSSFGPAEPSAEVKLHKLYVHPDWQRHGIGHALLNSCEAQARSGGATAISLNVNKRNVRAIAAYRKHGFTIRKSVAVDIGNGFVMDDYVMAKPLT
jgi:ribosomal protein S18 acetylase RimI-like enzyme